MSRRKRRPWKLDAYVVWSGYRGRFEHRHTVASYTSASSAIAALPRRAAAELAALTTSRLARLEVQHPASPAPLLVLSRSGSGEWEAKWNSRGLQGYEGRPLR